MIIQIRGTSGSGKTTVMREVMERLGTKEKYWAKGYCAGRRQPLFYENFSGGVRTVVLGHYEATCGGCDNIGSAKSVFELIQKFKDLDDIIICEGLLLSEDTKWTSRLSSEGGVKIVFLTTPLEECLTRVKSRREEAGNDKPLNPKNTSNRVAVIERARIKLNEAGIETRRCSSSQAPDIILKWMGLKPTKGKKRWTRNKHGSV